MPNSKMPNMTLMAQPAAFGRLAGAVFVSKVSVIVSSLNRILKCRESLQGEQ
jgi:hypothetical protein